jgi:two-component system CheB/CheR fusion protein
MDSAHAYAEHIISTVREPLVVLDPELRVESVNRAFYHTFGVTPADTIGRLLYDLGNRQWDTPELRRLLDEILPQNHTIDDFLVEWDFEHVGRPIMLLNARRMPSPIHGRIVLAIEDISERKRAEEALRESDRCKNEFLAMLAHELRNPLAPILVSVEVLRRARSGQVLDPKGGQGRADESSATIHDTGHQVKHAIDVLHRQVGHMVRLVDDLLDAGRISLGKIDLRRERVELSSVVYHVVDAVRPISDALNQELTVTLPYAPVYLNADPTRLAQIVGNILNNACKFTPRGGHIWLIVERGEQVAADASTAASTRVAQHVVIRVRDTGIGIGAEQLEHVFDMFMQADTSLERSLTGLGIGLTLVKTLTEMHGGTVAVSSDGVGQGSEFVVRLPITVDADRRSTQPTATASVATTPLRI